MEANFNYLTDLMEEIKSRVENNDILIPRERVDSFNSSLLECIDIAENILKEGEATPAEKKQTQVNNMILDYFGPWIALALLCTNDTNDLEHSNPQQ